MSTSSPISSLSNISKFNNINIKSKNKLNRINILLNHLYNTNSYISRNLVNSSFISHVYI